MNVAARSVPPRQQSARDHATMPTLSSLCLFSTNHKNTYKLPQPTQSTTDSALAFAPTPRTHFPHAYNKSRNSKINKNTTTPEKILRECRLLGKPRAICCVGLFVCPPRWSTYKLRKAAKGSMIVRSRQSEVAFAVRNQDGSQQDWRRGSLARSSVSIARCPETQNANSGYLRNSNQEEKQHMGT